MLFILIFVNFDPPAPVPPGVDMLAGVDMPDGVDMLGIVGIFVLDPNCAGSVGDSIDNEDIFSSSSDAECFLINEVVECFDNGMVSESSSSLSPEYTSMTCCCSCCSGGDIIRFLGYVGFGTAIFVVVGVLSGDRFSLGIVESGNVGDSIGGKIPES